MSDIAGARCWRCAREPASVRRLQRHREYYINDAGAQVDVLARSAFLRYREALGENIGEIPRALSRRLSEPVGQALSAEYGDSSDDVGRRLATDRAR